MQTNEMLALMDEVRKRAPVSYREAREALEQTEYNVLDAVLWLEKEGKVLPVQKQHGIEGSILLTHHNKELFRISTGAAGISAALLAIFRPKILAVLAGTILISGSDIVLVDKKNGARSLHKALKWGAGKSTAPIDDVKDTVKGRLDDRIQSVRDRQARSFFKDTKEQGEKYFTIRL